MCGIVGFSANPGFAFDFGYINFMLYWNSQERGKDSTGIYTPENGIIKSTQEAKVFIADLTKNILPDTLLIGHVRSRTVGTLSEGNAHPFIDGRIVLVHNGTLTNEYLLCKEFDLKNSDYNVDSQVLAAVLNKTKNADVLEIYAGAAALLFTDTKKPEILYAYHDKERPLFRGNREEGMYISSIKETLIAIGCTNIKEFVENYLYTITNGVIQTQIPISRNPFYWKDIEDIDKENDYNMYNSSFHKKTPTYEWGDNTIDLIDHMLLARYELNISYGIEVHIKKGNWYKCTGAVSDSKHTIKVLDENNKEISILKSTFDLVGSEMLPKMSVIFIKEGKEKETTIKMTSKGDVATIISYNYQKNTYLCQLINNEKWEVKPNMIRPLLKYEKNKNPLMIVKETIIPSIDMDAQDVADILIEVEGQVENLNAILYIDNKKMKTYQELNDMITEAKAKIKLLLTYLSDEFSELTLLEEKTKQDAN